MASGVDGLRPKVVWTFELRHHSSCRINKSPILSLCHTILLRGVRSVILMYDPLITKKFIQCVVLELGALFTPNSQYLCIMLTLRFIGKIDDGLLGLTLLLEEVNP